MSKETLDRARTSSGRKYVTTFMCMLGSVHRRHRLCIPRPMSSVDIAQHAELAYIRTHGRPLVRMYENSTQTTTHRTRSVLAKLDAEVAQPCTPCKAVCSEHVRPSQLGVQSRRRRRRLPSMRIHVLTQFPPELPFLLLLLCLPKLLFPGTLLFFQQSQKIRPSQLAV